MAAAAETPGGEPEWPAAVRIVRSARRRRTVSARADGDTCVVMIPAGAPAEQERRWVENMVARLRAGRVQRELNRARPLDERARELNERLFGGRLHWRSIEYVTDQQRRYGSCTPATGAIRISHRLASAPAWVRDYVIVHELAHLEHPDHSRAFWSAVNRYRLAERARGYLLALDFAPDGADG